MLASRQATVLSYLTLHLRLTHSLISPIRPRPSPRSGTESINRSIQSDKSVKIRNIYRQGSKKKTLLPIIRLAGLSLSLPTSNSTAQHCTAHCTATRLVPFLVAPLKYPSSLVLLPPCGWTASPGPDQHHTFKLCQQCGLEKSSQPSPLYFQLQDHEPALLHRKCRSVHQFLSCCRLSELLLQPEERNRFSLCPSPSHNTSPFSPSSVRKGRAFRVSPPWLTSTRCRIHHLRRCCRRRKAYSGPLRT